MNHNKKQKLTSSKSRVAIAGKETIFEKPLNNNLSESFPDRNPAIIRHANAIEKGFKSKDFELVNLSYAKLIESIRQQNINQPSLWEDNLNKVIGEYEAFRIKYKYEYPPQFLPPKGKESIIVPNQTLIKDGIIINQNSNFKLTLFNCPREIIFKVKSILENDKIYNKENALMPLFTEYNIQCVEIENYIEKYKPILEATINTLKARSTEWATASPIEQDDILEELVEEALNSLYEKADCDLSILFQSSTINHEIDDALIHKYGFDLVSKYLRFSYDMSKIHLNYERKEFEDLINAGLAYGGEDLHLEDILKVQTLKMLNQIAGKNETFFKRKDKAIEFIMNDPTSQKSISDKISKRKLFKLKELPSEFKIQNLEDISTSWNYIREYVRLVYLTFQQTKRYNEEIEHLKGIASGYKIRTWEIGDPSCTCKRSLDECKKRYSRNNPPSLPFHIGCRCEIQGLI